MNPSGLLMVISGVLVLCQVFGGNALGRLGISGSPDGSATSDSAPPPKSGLDGSGSAGSGGSGGGGSSW